MTARLDHLAVAATDLASGTAWLEARLGVQLAPGGAHPRMGTHNRVLRLGDGVYLELIAIDPDGPPPGRPRWFGLSTNRRSPRVLPSVRGSSPGWPRRTTSPLRWRPRRSRRGRSTR